MTTEDDTNAPDGVNDTAAPDLNDVERVAVKFGWSPKDQFRGKDEDWIDAESFLDRSVDVTKQLRKDHESYKKRLEATNRAAAKAIADNYERAKKEAEANLKAAIKSGDEDAIEEATQAVSDLPTKAELTRAQREFQENNPWFGVDEDATDWATGRAARLAQQGMSHAEQLETIEAEVKKKFPKLFDSASSERVDEPEPKRAPSVQGGTRAAMSAPKKKDWASIPSDVRKSAEANFIRNGLLSQDEYAKSYWEQNA